MRFLPLLSAFSLAVAPVALSAQTAAAPQQAAASDPDERLDEGLKGFGYLAGLARGCVADAQRTALEREVLDLHASISRLLGSDRAFLFSTSFGFGTSIKAEIKDCAEILKNYEGRVAKHRAAKGGA